MVEFVTLLLGLVAGPQVVEVAVGADAAQVRLLLDGELVATDEAPPWQLEFALGRSLRPRLLEAVAVGPGGTELGRARQGLNLPVAPAQVRIFLERQDGGQATAARLTWESSVGAYPLRSRAWFDGEQLPVTDPSRIPLPVHDERSLHLFEVELEFTSDIIARGHAALGGEFLDELRAELTAVPVYPRGKAKRAVPAQMSPWFRLVGPGESVAQPVRVVAYEKGGLDLVLVRGPGVSEALEDLEGTISEDLTSGGVASGSTTSGIEGSSPSAMMTAGNVGVANAIERLQRIMALESNQRLRIMAAQARKRAGRTVAMEVFALSPEITAEQGGLYWALGQRVELPGLATSLRLADAVAVAALQAANAHRRRAVLLVLSEPSTDESRHSVAEVREYLTAIQVPLFVWRVGESTADHWREWGAGEEIADFRQLQAAARRLADSLDRQRIVWLEGLHLPTAVRAAQGAPLEVVD